MSTLRIPVSDADHSRGPADARVTLVEYGDFQCPYCGQAFPVVRDLVARFGDDLRFVFRNFPIPELHPQAVEAAYVAEFAADSGNFWEAHDLLFEHQKSFGAGLDRKICERLDLSWPDLQEAFRTSRYSARISADEEGGIRSGVNGTPTFFLNGNRVDGGTFALESEIEALLR